jgi:predicted nucleic acid-binding protein
MRVLLDTNVLCRLAQVTHSMHAAADLAVQTLEHDGYELCLVPQILYEYWVVVTRPTSDNGLGMSPEAADRAVDGWLEVFTFLRDERGVFPDWRTIVRDREIKGKVAHDACIAAAMRRHNIANLLTFNVRDFERIAPDLNIRTPDHINQGLRFSG